MLLFKPVIPDPLSEGLAAGAVSCRAMTPTPEDPRPPLASVASRTAGPATEPVREVCPYLEAAEGGWRSVQATRDHRCTATSPASPLSLAKQRELCLQPAHFGCATYQAAREIVSELPAPGDDGLWPETRGAVLSLEAAPGPRGSVPGVGGRSTGQAVLIALMVVAFVLLVISRVGPPATGDAASSFDLAGAGSMAPASPPAPPASQRATASPSASGDAPTAGTSDDPASPAPSVTSGDPSAAPSASVPTTTYRVRRGDTLSGIAARFGVTVRALKAANGITDAALIRPGQVLVIPG